MTQTAPTRKVELDELEKRRAYLWETRQDASDVAQPGRGARARPCRQARRFMMLSCRETSRLLSDRLDRPLGARERFACT